jgi:mono/diheme cytochrome c family protein
MRRSVFTLLGIIISIALVAQSKKSSSNIKASLERGKVAFEQYCLACHQADGSGVQRLNPPLIQTKWVLGEKPTLINVVLKGLDEEIEVEGETYANTMPPLTHLTDQEIADVLTYVRNSFTNKASAVTPAEVKAERSKLTSK